MNTPQFERATRRAAVGGGADRTILAALCLMVLSLAVAQAQVQVKTLAGGPVVPGGSASGFMDGAALQSSQFDQPEGLAFDSGGRLYVADSGNGRIRILDRSADKARTLLSGLAMPVDLAIDAATNFYVLTAGDGSLTRYDRFGNKAGVLATGLLQPTSVTLDSLTNAYVAELGGTVRRITPAGVSTFFLSGLLEPRGVAITFNGQLAVSESGAHAIRAFDLKSGVVSTIAGGNGAGFLDGFSKDAKFNSPARIVRGPNGTLVVADRMNHRVRLVDTNGITTTLYGISPSDWVSDYPGWEDGSAEFAESREPVGVAVSGNGLSVVVSEAFYHLVREASGAALAGGQGGPGSGGSTPDGLALTLQPPTLSPSFGYHPMGQTVVVNSTAPKIYYTADGTDPTTNSFLLPMNAGQGRVYWQDSTRDLRSLRLRAVDGTNASPVASGVSAAVNEIGIPRDLTAGPGSVAIVPVVVNLRTNTPVKSLQYRAEITPLGGAPAISDQFRALGISTNDFIPVVTTADTQGGTRFTFYGYGDGNTRGLAITFIGTNANFSVRDFAVVGMLSVPIPKTAVNGSEYSIRILQVSATSDAQQSDLVIEPMASRRIVVAASSFLVGDSSRSRWYNAEQLGAGTGEYGFGDGQLLNSDVNNAFLASFGFKVPYPGSDLFVAMDAYPEDNDSGVGGDGQIRFLDWQVILERSLGTEIPAIGTHTNLWRRSWVSPLGLIQISDKNSAKVSARSFSKALPPPPGGAWYRNAALHAVPVENAASGKVVDVPIELVVIPGSTISGLQFRASVSATDGAPPLSGPVEFILADGLPAPIQVDNPPAGEVGCAWSLLGNQFVPPLTGVTKLGFIRFTVPAFARSGHCYTVRFGKLDGSPLPVDSYAFETFPACVWVHSAALRKADRTSEEWRLAYFGSTSVSDASEQADPDDDGVPNASEYLAGTDPSDGQSNLRVSIQRRTSASGNEEAVIRWATALGKIYHVECSQDLVAWTVIAASVAGDGQEAQVIHKTATDKAQYYRVRLAP